MPVVILGSPGPILITDGINIAAVKPASTPASSADPALVVALSPGSPMPPPASLPLPTGAATQTTLAAVLAELDVALSTRASQTTLASVLTAVNTTAAATASIATETDVALSTRAADTTLTGGTAKTRVTDGTNTAAVKAASTAPIATDPALVVSISPNSGLTVAPVTSSTATVSSVSGSASSVQLLALNTSRKNATFFNESTATLYLKLGTSASVTSYTAQVPPNGYYELPSAVYTGRIDGIWSSAAGAVRITELT
jgi:hypothetical protein